MVFYNETSVDIFRRFNAQENAHLVLSNDSNLNTLSFSLDGISEIGYLQSNETLELKDVNLSDLYIKSKVVGNACVFRLWFFGNRKLVYPVEQLDATNIQVPLVTRFKKVVL